MPTTSNKGLERLARLEEKVDGVVSDLHEIKDAIKGLDEKFASKYIERLVWVVITGVASGIMYLVVAALSHGVPH